MSGVPDTQRLAEWLFLYDTNNQDHPEESHWETLNEEMKELFRAIVRKSLMPLLATLDYVKLDEDQKPPTTGNFRMLAEGELAAAGFHKVSKQPKTHMELRESAGQEGLLWTEVPNVEKERGN